MKKKEKQKQHGGARAGAGRPSTLKDPIRRNITFEERHLARLARYAKRNRLSGYSAAIRDLINRHT